jgi:hypothetical protein
VYITKTPSKRSSGKTYHCVLLRESYREGGRVKNRTVANLSHCSQNEIKAIELALAHKDNLQAIATGPLKLVKGKKIGAAYVLSQLADRLGLTTALGNSFNGKLGLFQVIVRVLEQGSRLSATRIAQGQDIVSVIDLQRGFDENDLYANLGWLAEHQSSIEDQLFKQRTGPVTLYLYDVTSSYFEGTENELAEYGYNRDGKKRKKQIVVGLLCDHEGGPVSVSVFEGNTQDVETFIFQVQTVIERFGCVNVTFVGDRGMIKSDQIEAVQKEECHYITALTLPQIGKLIKDKILGLEDFVADLREVLLKDEKVRYIYRRNPQRAKETMDARKERLAKAQEKVDYHNAHLLERPKTKLRSAKKAICAYLRKLFLDEWVKVDSDGRHIALVVDEDALAEKAKFDGYYVIKTNLCDEKIPLRTVFERYKDLAMVEWAFRTSKTTHLNLRPIYVRNAANTRGHVFVVMLAYILVRELSRAWNTLNFTVEEGLDELAGICRTEAQIGDGQLVPYIPLPDERCKSLLDALGMKLPSSIKQSAARVVSKRGVREGVEV